MKNSNSFTIYNASAGSGKTFTLVKEYLLLLFTSGRNDSYKNILAITFTNKAVEEMKSRIVDNLYGFSKQPVPKKFQPLLEIICNETGSSEEEITARSKEILKHIIHNYAAFEVSTIDGFTHRVLRTFAKDLDLPLNFEVELNTSEVLQEAVERLINRAGKDKELTRVLINFSLSKTDEDKSWDIARDLYKIAELVNSENNQAFLQLLKGKKLEDFENLSKELKKQKALFEEGVVEMANKFFDLIQDNGLEKADFLRGSCPGFFEKLQKGDFSVGFDAQWQTSIADQPLYAKKLDDNKKRILDGLQSEVVNYFQETKRYLIQIQFFTAIQKNLTPLSLLSAIQEEISAIKKERAIVMISEFNATIGSAVKDQPAPFIYERLGERYRHYFIDEFQDTSQLQWENLIPLVDHTLTTEHPVGETGSLTLVGDAKQSIYRWRGGKAEQFMDLCGTGNPFNLEEKEVVLLPYNYRSAKQVVDFNNDFFQFSSSCFTNIEHKKLFEETSSQQPKNLDEGYVNLSFIEAENAEEEMRVYPEKVLEIIKNLEAKEVSKSDICILTRRKKEGVAIASFLSENGVPVISAESLLLSQSRKVNFISAVLQFSVDGQDKNLKLPILEYILEHQLKIENFYSFISERLEINDQQFFDSLKSFGIDFNINRVTEASLYEAVEYIIRSFGLVTSSDAYVQSFLDFVYEISQKENHGIFEFLELWEQKKDRKSIAASPDEDAVQIMTIHKAKGLEFPVVIFPFANSSITDVARESLWMDLPETLSAEIPVGYLKATKDMLHWGERASFLYDDLCHYSQLDALNVLYVALTRPVKQLYVISKYELSKGKENSNKFSGLFISWLKQKGVWEDNRHEYEFGNKEDLPASEGERTSSTYQQEHYYSSATEGSAVSIITKSGLLWDSSQAKAIEKGHLVHDIFAQINTSEDVEVAISNAREEGLFRNKEEEEIRKSIMSVVNHPELQKFYASGAENFNERDIITATGTILRPDRLNFFGKNVSIIDYKTGEVNAKHKNQIISYGEVLAGMGFSVDKRILVYINEEVSLSIV